MKRIVLALLVGAGLLAGASTASACRDNQLIEIDGTVNRIFPNKGNTWSVVVGHLKDSSLSGCDFFSGTGGQKTANGLWIVLTSPRKPAECQQGEHISAVIKVEDLLLGADYKTVSLECR